MRLDPPTEMPARIGRSRRMRLASGLACAVALVVVSCTSKLTPVPATSVVPAPTEERFRPVAVAGTTVAYRLGNVIHLCDLTTSTDTDLGPEPVDGGIQAAGPSGFVLHGLGKTYAISSTAH